MTNPNRTEIVCIIDRSGSMAAIKHDAEGGVNSFMEQNKKLPGKVCVTLAQFDDSYDLLWNNIDIQHVPHYTLEPRGCTALLDAVGRTIEAVGERLAGTPEHERPGKIVVMIVTDGQENASRRYSRAQIFGMITHQTKKYAWEFTYIGANQDSFAEASNIGIPMNNALDFRFSSGGCRSAFAAAGKYVSSYVCTNNTNGFKGIDLDADPNLTTSASKSEPQPPK